ncbi:MAG: hypothetical protein LIO53_07000 [Oscillospiraceae bacterium]|nr:hypothetical protein [Oscillospiraceae bacterium]
MAYIKDYDYSADYDSMEEIPQMSGGYSVKFSSIFDSLNKAFSAIVNRILKVEDSRQGVDESQIINVSDIPDVGNTFDVTIDGCFTHGWVNFAFYDEDENDISLGCNWCEISQHISATNDGDGWRGTGGSTLNYVPYIRLGTVKITSDSDSGSTTLTISNLSPSGSHSYSTSGLGGVKVYYELY